MVDPVTPVSLVPTSMVIDPTTGGLPSFIEMEQKKQDAESAKAFSKVTLHAKDGFASLIPKAFLAEANEADESAKLTSTNSEMGKYLASMGVKIALEEGLAKAISSASSFGALQASFASGWVGASLPEDNEIASAVADVQGTLSQATDTQGDSNDQNEIQSEHQNFFQGASMTGNFMNAVAQANRAIKNSLDKMVSQMQGDAGTVSSLVASLYSQGS